MDGESPSLQLRNERVDNVVKRAKPTGDGLSGVERVTSRVQIRQQRRLEFALALSSLRPHRHFTHRENKGGTRLDRSDKGRDRRLHWCH
jgi:hypothetical protein